ncbi:hypothetical protein HK405_001114, partial [Cladochytrium tenue]
MPDLVPISANEGCNLAGQLSVNKVAGNFHLAPGHIFQLATGAHVHDLTGDAASAGLATNNFAHVIHSLAFGQRVAPSIPGRT